MNAKKLLRHLRRCFVIWVFKKYPTHFFQTQEGSKWLLNKPTAQKKCDRIEDIWVRILGLQIGYAQRIKILEDKILIGHFAIDSDWTDIGLGRTFNQALVRALQRQFPVPVWFHTYPPNHQKHNKYKTFFDKLGAATRITTGGIYRVL